MTRTLAFAALLLIAAVPAKADPGYYVVSAYDNEGLRSIDFRYWTVKFPSSSAIVWPEVGFGYGVSSRWYTELYGSWIGSSEMATRLSTLNWQNEFLLTQGEWPIDVALHGSLIQDQIDRGGYTLEWGPVLQTDIGRTQLNANLFFEHGYDGARPMQAQLKYQWQVKYRWQPLLQVGLQGFGELGPWDHWAPHDKQSHRVGPAVFGRLPLGGGQALSYQAAFLVGSIYGHNGNMFSMRVQYGF